MDFTAVPIGFGFVLMQNEEATSAYAMMTCEQKNAILPKANDVRNEQKCTA